MKVVLYDPTKGLRNEEDKRNNHQRSDTLREEESTSNYRDHQRDQQDVYDPSPHPCVLNWHPLSDETSVRSGCSLIFLSYLLYFEVGSDFKSFHGAHRSSERRAAHSALFA